MICEALRQFDARGKTYEKGDEVDTSAWPIANVDAMISQRWIAQLEHRTHFAAPKRARRTKRSPLPEVVENAPVVVTRPALESPILEEGNDDIT